jgi:phosphatidylethanolamine/phosphatidyl-N-methylethanolamine N-methyltransferase
MALESTVPQAYESKLYGEYSGVYDLIFARFFYPRIAAVIRDLRIPPGAKVLELGVGTGLALRAYPPHCQVTGVDLAPDMLERAQERIARKGWRHIQLHEMDAMSLAFEDSSFDYVMAFHVVSVVPQADRFMKEAQRVCRPDGKIVVVNHFRSDRRVLAAIDRKIEPLTRRVGWHTLGLQEVFSGLPLDMSRVYKTSRRSLFTIVVARNAKGDSGAVAEAPAIAVAALPSGGQPLSGTARSEMGERAGDPCA